MGLFVTEETDVDDTPITELGLVTSGLTIAVLRSSE